MNPPDPIDGRDAPRSLRANVAWTLAGNGVYAAGQWGMLIALSKLADPTTVGRFALALALTAPVVMLANMQLRAVLATDARREHPFGSYVSVRFAASLAAMAVIAVLAFGAGYDPVVAPVILLIGVGKIFESWSDIYLGYLQQRERMDLVSRSMILKGAVFLAAFVLGAFGGGLVAAVAALALARLILLLAVDVPMVVRLSGAGLRTALPSGTRRGLGRLAWIALPLGAATMLSSLQTNIPRYFIEHFDSAGALGVFAAMSYLMVIGGLVVNALGQSASPRLAAHFAAGELKEFRRLLWRLVGMGAGLGAAAVLAAALAGRWILTVLYTAEYARDADLFTLLAVVSGLVYASIFFGTALNAMRRFAVKVPLQALGAAVLAGLCWWLVPGGGVRGAVWAMLIATFVSMSAQAAVALILLRRGPSEPVNEGG